MVWIGVNGTVNAQFPPHPLPFDPIVWTCLGVFYGLAIYGTAEILAQVFSTFKKRSGLYFWSIVTVSVGCLVHNFGLMLHFQVASANWLVFTIIVFVTWWIIQTGIGIVVWSRLHLVVQSPKILRWVLTLILVDFVILQIPNTVLAFLAADPNNSPETQLRMNHYFVIMDRIQVVGFGLQDSFLAGLYLPFTWRILKPNMGDDVKLIMRPLLYVFILTVFLDVSLITLSMAGLTSLKCVINSLCILIKLRFELTVLNQLSRVAKRPFCPSQIVARWKLDVDEEGSSTAATASRPAKAATPTTTSVQPTTNAFAVGDNASSSKRAQSPGYVWEVHSRDDSSGVSGRTQQFQDGTVGFAR